MGVIEALDERDCLVSRARTRSPSSWSSPAPHCPGCHQALTEIHELLTSITGGTGTMESIEDLEKACRNLKRPPRHLSREAVNPILTSLHYFREEYEHHVLHKYCDALVCPKLLPAPCHLACPAGIDIPSFLALIADGKHQEAWEVMRRTILSPGLRPGAPAPLRDSPASGPIWMTPSTSATSRPLPRSG